MSLTLEQKSARIIGGSDANIILGGDKERIHNLWLEKTGQREPDDLSGILAVRMGQFTEPLNREWFERKTGKKVVRYGESAAHPKYVWMTATLDGMVDDCVFEAKHVSGRESMDTVVNRYMPQSTHNMIVMNAPACYLSVLIGTGDYEFFKIDRSAQWDEAVIAAVAEFYECVVDMRPPIEIPALPPRVEPYKTVDMTGNNLWADHAVDYLQNEGAAKKFEIAKKSLKELVADDTLIARGHGIEIKRSKNGSLTFRKETA